MSRLRRRVTGTTFARSPSHFGGHISANKPKSRWGRKKKKKVNCWSSANWLACCGGDWPRWRGWSGQTACWRNQLADISRQEMRPWDHLQQIGRNVSQSVTWRSRNLTIVAVLRRRPSLVLLLWKLGGKAVTISVIPQTCCRWSRSGVFVVSQRPHFYAKNRTETINQIRVVKRNRKYDQKNWTEEDGWTPLVPVWCLLPVTFSSSCARMSIWDHGHNYFLLLGRLDLLAGSSFITGHLQPAGSKSAALHFFS